jgi:hypothetical protein
MRRISSSLKAVTVGEYVASMTETVVTVWFARFKVSMELLPDALAEIQEGVDEFRIDRTNHEPSIWYEPAKVGLYLASDSKLLDLLGIFDGTPVTRDKLVEAGVVFSVAATCGLANKSKVSRLEELIENLHGSN